MTEDEREVLARARARGGALSDADAAALAEILHERFSWTSHRGETYDRDEYVRRNTTGHTTWVSQELVDPNVVVEGDTAVLRADVVDVIELEDGPAEFRMPMTQTWVRDRGRWRCLAGHAGPRRA